VIYPANALTWQELFTKAPAPVAGYAAPDFAHIHQELKRKGVTRRAQMRAARHAKSLKSLSCDRNRASAKMPPRERVPAALIVATCPGRALRMRSAMLRAINASPPLAS
jgi:plasmid stability protein